jgi:S1/P1 Nuclease
MTKIRVVIACALLLSALGLDSPVFAWGCKGHQIVALIAESHLNPNTRVMVKEILDAAPIDPALNRYCGQSGLDAFADSSTWADDERTIRPDTSTWHYLDIPRGASQADARKFCAPEGCVTSAIEAQLAILRDTTASARARGEALRFLIHFVGDMHQPLHLTTNNDRGGNCVPVEFFGFKPLETNPQKEDYRPNLHSVWDTDIVEHFSQGQTPQQAADALETKLRVQSISWQSKSIDVQAWAWESHRIAEGSAYGKLPTKIRIEAPKRVATCADDNHISARMLALHEQVDESYQAAAEPVVEEQLMKAGVRLAMLLNNLWPSRK